MRMPAPSNIDAFAGRSTTVTSRSERMQRAEAYYTGALSDVVCPFLCHAERNAWHSGLYDGFVRREKSRAGGPQVAYDIGFQKGLSQITKTP